MEDIESFSTCFIDTNDLEKEKMLILYKDMDNPSLFSYFASGSLFKFKNSYVVLQMSSKYNCDGEYTIAVLLLHQKNCTSIWIMVKKIVIMKKYIKR